MQHRLEKNISRDLIDSFISCPCYLKIGDKEYNYQDLLKYRTHTDAFNLNFANNGLFGIIQGGPIRAVADGFYVMTAPLAKGTYLIHITLGNEQRALMVL